jgi:hypothetical protein
VKDLTERCLSSNPKERPSARELCDLLQVDSAAPTDFVGRWRSPGKVGVQKRTFGPYLASDSWALPLGRRLGGGAQLIGGNRAGCSSGKAAWGSGLFDEVRCTIVGSTFPEPGPFRISGLGFVGPTFPEPGAMRQKPLGLSPASWSSVHVSCHFPQTLHQSGESRMELRR